MSNSPIPAVYKSIVREITDMIEELNASGLHPTLEYHNWENRANENELPKVTLIGLDGFTFDENEGRWLIRYAMGISSYLDENMLNEIELIGAIHERLGEGKKITLRNMIDGEAENELVVSAFKMMPMAQSEIRNYRTIALELLRTGS